MNQKFTYSKKKLCSALAVVLAAIIASTVCVTLCLILSPQVNSAQELNGQGIKIDYVILLGGGIKRDGTLPKTVKNRVQKTAEFCSEYRIAEPKIIATGGITKFSKHKEAPALKKFLIQNGISETQIYTESQSRDTIQNFRNSVAIICKIENCSQDAALQKNIVIVTSFFHLNRAEFLAARMGLKNTYGIPSEIPYYKYFPCYCREILSYVKLSLRILFTNF